MGIVRVLPDHLANQIAAGEVVERPASALKELVENSLDAGATSIRIFLKSGGKREIVVEDNGHGMDRDDCMMAMERHATSKLTRAEDLFSIQSLGFRGEALPSIASVSRFSLQSRTAEAEAGVKIQMNGSKLVKVSEIPMNPGTKITVGQLFFNIPARRKFLRTTQTELSWMVNLVTQYSMAHFDKQFYLENDGRKLLDLTPVRGLKERIYQHFGKKMLDQLIPVSGKKDWLELEGMVSGPNYFKTSRNYQYLFVNGRIVRDRVLNNAISQAYEGFGEGRIFPVAFVFLRMPSVEVDVNVHPAKTEVKFIHGDFVHHQVRDTLRNALVKQKLTVDYRFREGYHPHPSQTQSRRDPWVRSHQATLPGNDPVQQTPLFSGNSPTPADSKANSGFGRHTPYGQFLKNQGTLQANEPDPPVSSQTLSGSGQSQPAENSLFEGDPALSVPKIIGQFRDSYILAEQNGDLLLIDQHVAHERILYDRITESLEKDRVERQALLVPVTIELTPQQSVELRQLLPAVRKFGFDLEPFDGHTYVVREIPPFFSGEDLESLVVELVEKVQGQRRESLMETLTDHFAATKACKAAVKINMHLTPEKMNHLMDELWRSSSPLFCPHGRPIVLKFSNEEIEKNFLRR